MRAISIHRISLTILFLLSIQGFAGSYTNERCGYSIVLPENWDVLNASDSQDIFFDAASDGKTFLSVVHHRIEKTTLEADWTRYHFWMYLSVTQEWEDPWGTVLAIDSSQNSTLDQVWAPQAFARFFTLDEEHWSEYIMFAAKYHSGYELYAIGDTLDLEKNGSYYSQIIQTVTFSDVSPIFKVNKKNDFKIKSSVFDDRSFDLFGRLIPKSKFTNKSTVLIIRNKTKSISNIH